MAPFSSVKSFNANMELTVSSGPGQGKCGQLPSSRCSIWAGSPPPMIIV